MVQKNYEVEASRMKGVVEERYGEEFSVEYFLPAKDKAYDNILTLSDKDGTVFNAYQAYGDTVVSDDYPEALVSRRLTQSVVSSPDASPEWSARVLGIVRDGKALTADFAKNKGASALNLDFVKVIACVAVTGELSKYKAELFDIYNGILKFNSDLIEFEAISFSEPGERLSRVLSNPLGYYDNNWETFPEISDFIDVRSKDIVSAEDLMGRRKGW